MTTDSAEIKGPDERASPSIDRPDADPHLWLEAIDKAEAVAWADAQSRDTLARFGDAGFAADADRLTTLYDRPDNVPFIRRRGDFVYNFWRDAGNPKGIWRRTLLSGYRAGAPHWDVLFDLDAFAAAEGRDWVWRGAEILQAQPNRAIFSLSEGGADAAALREFDLTERRIVEDGFSAPPAKGYARWLTRDALLIVRAEGEGGPFTTEAGYASTIRLWRRGAPLSLAPILFEVDRKHMAVDVSVDRSTQEDLVWFTDRIGFYESVHYLGYGTGPAVQLDLPKDAEVAQHRGWLAVKLRSDWARAGQSFASDSLLGLRLSDALTGTGAPVVLFAPAERAALKDFFWCGGRLTVLESRNLETEIVSWTPAAEGWERSAGPEAPVAASVRLYPLDAFEEEADGSLLMTVETPIEPQTLSLAPPLGAPLVLRRAPERFNAQGLSVARHEAVAEDGVRIPYVQTGPADAGGDAPVHLSGYGGFGLSVEPYYNSAIGALWLERGGVSVTAHIRGGGEFGAAWHEAGRGRNKAVSHADFAAIAADLVRRGVTRPGRIAAEGGSNGGLLIANMLTRYPERFGALFCTIPLIDMRRFSKLLAGPSWVAEYGDPDKPEDWAHLAGVSAYHQAVGGQPYPPILIATTRRDDRVHPGHARKMAAKLQRLGYVAPYFEAAGGGHGYGATNAERARFIALGYRFLAKSIGWG